jgi:hypothetical protein
LTVQHSAIPDAQRHEPKGIDSAAVGTAYICDGAASGSWLPVQQAQYACLRATSATNTTGITTAYQVINNATLGGTIAWVENVASGITTNATSGYMTVPDTGVYHIIVSLSIVSATNPSTYSFTIGIDSGAGIVSQEASILSQIKTTSTSDTKVVVITCLPSLTASDKVYLMVKEAAGNELSITHTNFTLTRVS